MWAWSLNIAGAGWSGTAQAISYDTIGRMDQAFRNIVNMLHGVRDELARDANNYEHQEHAFQRVLSSSPTIYLSGELSR
ncbi:hypothetical protein MHAE_19271 [Mycobacterium haemophilum DSM 44634]|nr:WXG100 family type VII secretion target [Mycobacterium haemophilum DSM 44634]